MATSHLLAAGMDANTVTDAESGAEEKHYPPPAAPALTAGIRTYQASTDWQEYLERFEFSCFAQGIVDVQRKKALLLASVGQEAYTTIKSVLSPLSPVNVPYKELLEKVGKYFAPKKSVILSRFKFNQCVQEPGQLTAEFIAKLKRLAEKCDFDQTLDCMLRDRLVCGVRDSALQKRLLAEEDSLTFAVAEKLSLAAESVIRDVSQLTAGRDGGAPAPEAVHLAAPAGCGPVAPRPGARVKVSGSAPGCCREERSARTGGGRSSEAAIDVEVYTTHAAVGTVIIAAMTAVSWDI